MSGEERNESDRRVQDAFLQSCVEDKCAVRVFLKSGVKLHGQILDYDAYSFLLTTPTDHTHQKGKVVKPQLVFKSGVATIAPGSDSDSENSYGGQGSRKG